MPLVKDKDKDKDSHYQRRSSSRLAFGSCNDQDRENKLWDIIRYRNPAAFVWGGDAIYADTRHGWSSSVQCATPERVQKLYQQQSQIPAYRRLVQGNTTILGTIDDHDYGCDNADRYFPHKNATTQAFVHFLQEPVDSLLAKRVAQGRGVYSVKLLDFERPEGHEVVPDIQACIDPDILTSSCTLYQSKSDKTVAVFTLDVRTHKDPWQRGWKYWWGTSDIQGDMLGEAQWQWLEKALASSTATVNVVVTGLQVHADFVPDPNLAESWNGFPKSQQRLYDLLLRNSMSLPILISGDVHLTQLLRKECRPRHDENSQKWRSLVELTTSGMTHSWGQPPNQRLTHPESTLVRAYQRLSSWWSGHFMHAVHWTRNWSHLVESTPGVAHAHNGGLEGTKQGLQYSLERNFGELEFDWEQRAVSIRSIGEAGRPLLSSRMSMGPSEAVSDHNMRHVPDELSDGWICVGTRNFSGSSVSASVISSISGVNGSLVMFLVIVLWVVLVGWSRGWRWSRRDYTHKKQKSQEIPAPAPVSSSVLRSVSSASCGC